MKIISMLMALLVSCSFVQAEGDGSYTIDWDVLQHLPAKAIKSHVAELRAKDLDTEGIALESSARPAPSVIYENEIWQGATTHYAGIDIPNVFDPTQKMGKWTVGEWVTWGAGALVAAATTYVVAENNSGSSAAPTPTQSASITVSSGKRSASIKDCAGNAHAKIEDHESGSGDIEAHCAQPTK